MACCIATNSAASVQNAYHRLRLVRIQVSGNVQQFRSTKPTDRRWALRRECPHAPSLAIWIAPWRPKSPLSRDDSCCNGVGWASDSRQRLPAGNRPCTGTIFGYQWVPDGRRGIFVAAKRPSHIIQLGSGRKRSGLPIGHTIRRRASSPAPLCGRRPALLRFRLGDRRHHVGDRRRHNAGFIGLHFANRPVPMLPVATVWPTFRLPDLICALLDAIFLIRCCFGLHDDISHPGVARCCPAQ